MYCNDKSKIVARKAKFYNSKKGMGAQTTWWNYVSKVRVYDGYIGFISVPIFHEEPDRERMGIRTYENGKWSDLIWRPEEVMN